MPHDSASEPSVLPGPRTRDNEGIGYRRGKAHISGAEAQHKAWLPWSSNGCAHGDRAPVISSRRKSKGIGSRQWEGR